MTTIQFSSSSEFSDEEIAATLQSRGFLQLLLYQKLGDGLRLLQEHDALRDAVVSDLTAQHSQIESEDVTREFLDVFSDEVFTWSKPMFDEIGDDVQVTITNAAEQRSESPTDAEATVQNYLESRLSQTNPIELKANEIAAETGLQSTHVGAILGKWRKSNDAPFSVSASETPGGSNIWTIETTQSGSSGKPETSA
jgi:hypothetical protein